MAGDPFKDDWTELSSRPRTGSRCCTGGRRGWNWFFLGGYPTSTTSPRTSGRGVPAMTLFGDRVGYHVLHLGLFLAVPFSSRGNRGDERETACSRAPSPRCSRPGISGRSARAATRIRSPACSARGWRCAGSRAATLGRRWGGPLLLAGLTLALYSHAAFFVYACIYLALEAAWFRDRAALVRLLAAAPLAAVASLPMHWESLRSPGVCQLQQHHLRHGCADRLGQRCAERLLQHRNPHAAESLVQRLPEPRERLAARARAGRGPGGANQGRLLRRSGGRHAGPAPVQYAVGRGGIRRIQHMLPLIVAPALAGFVLRFAGTRRLAAPS